MLINLQKIPKSMNCDGIMEGYSHDPLGVEKARTVDKLHAGKCLSLWLLIRTRFEKFFLVKSHLIPIYFKICGSLQEK